MLKTEERGSAVLSALPEKISFEILNICRGRRGGLGALREIRLRTEGRVSVRLGREKIYLGTGVLPEEMEETVKKLCGGAVYAHRSDISAGFISMGQGVRVGVVGSAGYENGGIVGVSEISSLVFRIPGGECEFGEQLYSVFRQGIGAGMLIYSPPGVGKTTALRYLARRIGSGRAPLSVCVVDERREFCEEEYLGCEVDILKGYKKRAGLEIAVRTMSAEVVMIDEIGADDASAITDVLHCGVPLIATAHAKSIEELKSKTSLRPLLDAGVFDVFVGIASVAEGYELAVERR